MSPHTFDDNVFSVKISFLKKDLNSFGQYAMISAIEKLAGAYLRPGIGMGGKVQRVFRWWGPAPAAAFCEGTGPRAQKSINENELKKVGEILF